jgi:hypothetical protein
MILVIKDIRIANPEESTDMDKQKGHIPFNSDTIPIIAIDWNKKILLKYALTLFMTHLPKLAAQTIENCSQFLSQIC